MANSVLIGFKEDGSMVRVRNRLGTDLTSEEPVTNPEKELIRAALGAAATEISLGVIRCTDAAYGALGNGAANDTAALTAAVTAATNGTTKVVLVPAGTYVTNDLTVPSSVLVWFLPGAKLSVNSGQTVTINGPIEAGPWQIFTGSGSVVLNGKVGNPPVEWWGALGDGATDDTSAFTKAVVSVPLKSRISCDGTYIIDTVAIARDVGFKLHSNAVLKHKANATNHMIRYTAACTTPIEGGTLDGNKANQTVASNNFGLLFSCSNGQTIGGVTFQNYVRAGILDFQTLGDLNVQYCKFLDGLEIADSDNTAEHVNCGLHFAPGLAGGAPRVTVDHCVFKQSATVTASFRAPGGVLFLGSDANSSYNAVSMSHCYFYRVGDQSPNGRGIAAIDIYEDTYNCALTDILIEETYFTAAKLQNCQNLTVNGLTIRDCSYTTVIDYVPGERTQENEYKNATFNGVIIDECPAGGALYMHAGDEGGFHNVTVANFIARDVLYGIRMNGLNSGETEYEGFGPVQISNAQIWTVGTQAAVSIENMSGSVKISNSYINAAAGHGVRCVTNNSSTAKVSISANTEIITGGANGFYCFDIWGVAELTLDGVTCEQTGGFAIGRLSHASATHNIGKMIYNNVITRTGTAPTVTWSDIDEVVGELTFAGAPGTIGVNAKRGARFSRTDGGASTCFYVKESDTGSTGWVAK